MCARWDCGLSLSGSELVKRPRSPEWCRPGVWPNSDSQGSDSARLVAVGTFRCGGAGFHVPERIRTSGTAGGPDPFRAASPCPTTSKRGDYTDSPRSTTSSLPRAQLPTTAQRQRRGREGEERRAQWSGVGLASLCPAPDLGGPIQPGPSSRPLVDLVRARLESTPSMHPARAHA